MISPLIVIPSLVIFWIVCIDEYLKDKKPSQHKLKLKLWKKVKKRYCIEYYPHGFKREYVTIDSPVVVSFDGKGLFWEHILGYTILKEGVTKELAYDIQYSILRNRILRNYRGYGTRRNNLKEKAIKLWHK